MPFIYHSAPTTPLPPARRSKQYPAEWRLRGVPQVSQHIAALRNAFLAISVHTQQWVSIAGGATYSAAVLSSSARSTPPPQIYVMNVQNHWWDTPSNLFEKVINDLKEHRRRTWVCCGQLLFVQCIQPRGGGSLTREQSRRHATVVLRNPVHLKLCSLNQGHPWKPS